MLVHNEQLLRMSYSSTHMHQYVQKPVYLLFSIPFPFPFACYCRPLSNTFSLPSPTHSSPSPFWGTQGFTHKKFGNYRRLYVHIDTLSVNKNVIKDSEWCVSSLHVANQQEQLIPDENGRVNDTFSQTIFFPLHIRHMLAHWASPSVCLRSGVWSLWLVLNGFRANLIS